MSPRPETMEGRQGAVSSRDTSAPVHWPQGASMRPQALHRDFRRHRSRYHSQGAITAGLPSQHAGAEAGQTWIDFLRQTGQEQQTPNPPAYSYSGDYSSQHGAPSRTWTTASIRAAQSSQLPPVVLRGPERRRRSTMDASPTQRPGNNTPSLHTEPTSSDPFVPQTSPPPGPQPSALAYNALHLPLPPLPSYSNSSNIPRRDSDIVLPPWQPDSEVSYCPVCGREFTFWYRKHHCRYVPSPPLTLFTLA
jgi:hypothetical protein